MKEIIDKDLDIKRELIKTNEADKIFKKQNMKDKLRLSKYRQKEDIHVYNLDGFYDKFYGYLAPSTGFIDKFNLKYYRPGIIIQYPREDSNFDIPDFIEQNKLAKIFKETETWGEILDVGNVGALNDKVKDGSIGDIIRVSETLHEKKLSYIADSITNDKNIRIILIAGPSSSGKTTFAQRLSIHLRVNGKKPISISLDDYFVNREDTPLDENGEYDFESIDAIDIEKFNEDLIKLINGDEVRLPKFDFISGKRKFRDKPIKINKDQPIIIEGIHGLNEKLTRSIPKNNKFKVYVSALTQLNIDYHNRIPTTDTRLLRRMVRDHNYRGNDAVRTLKLWDSVRKGEESNIFPYQEEADVMFNSALVYELAVLKKYAEPLLKEIDSSSKYYAESKRLLKFLNYFKDISEEENIPNTSIIREFVGGSCFRED
ncbi:MAG: nucleoside kinase [Firmicutes bacterium]|nr:nucleoside kinase [Bacillota bacterium]